MNQRLIHLADAMLETHKKSGDPKEFLKNARIYIQNAYDQGAADKAAELAKPEHPKVDESAKRPSDAEQEAAALAANEAAAKQAASEAGNAPASSTPSATPTAATDDAGKGKAKSKADAKKAAETF